MSGNTQQGGQNNQAAESHDPTSPYEAREGEPSHPEIDRETMFDWRSSSSLHYNLNHLVGLPDIRQTLDETIVDPINTTSNDYDRFMVGPKDLLLAGPPGTGKSHAAKCALGELDVPFLILNQAEVMDDAINRSAKLIHQLFKEANELAHRYQYVAIYLDEIDAVLPSRDRNDRMHNEGRKIVNQFLNKLEDTTEKGIVFIGATNRPEALSDAATRQGRLNETLKFGLPNQTGRMKQLKYHLSDRPHDISENQLRMIAQALEGETPATIKTLIEDAAREAAYTSSDRIVLTHIRNQDQLD